MCKKSRAIDYQTALFARGKAILGCIESAVLKMNHRKAVCRKMRC